MQVPYCSYLESKQLSVITTLVSVFQQILVQDIYDYSWNCLLLAKIKPKSRKNVVHNQSLLKYLGLGLWDSIAYEGSIMICLKVVNPMIVPMVSENVRYSYCTCANTIDYFLRPWGNTSRQVSQNLSVKNKHEFETFLHQVNIVKNCEK